jgi:large subunit ribosomal protein L29
MKVTELREMSPEQLELTLQETAKNLFRLRMQAQTERLSTPSELRSHRKTVARIKTIQRERQAAAAATADAPA